VRIENFTPLGSTQSSERAEAHWRAFASTHTILGVRGGAFISLLDPPGELKDIAARATIREPAGARRGGGHDGHDLVVADHPL